MPCLYARSSYNWGMVRSGNWNQPAGVSPARVGTGAPGSRPQFAGETRRAERGVKIELPKVGVRSSDPDTPVCDGAERFEEEASLWNG